MGTIPPQPEVARQIAYYEPPEASSSRIRPDRVPSTTIGTRTLGERMLSTAGVDSDLIRIRISAFNSDLEIEKRRRSLS